MAVVIDGRTLQSTCESGPCAGYDGHKRKMGSQVKALCEAKKGFVLLPRRWVARFRRLSRDFERLPQVLAGLHFVAFLALGEPAISQQHAQGELQPPFGHEGALHDQEVVHRGLSVQGLRVPGR